MNYEKAVTAIKEAEAFLITAGAGMGVDSGLPDFRGDAGFWKAYPACARLGLSLIECASPMQLVNDPHFAWGFYGHLTNLFRNSSPHEGFSIIKKWIERNAADYFVVTSNVDGQFQKAGYDEKRISEIHGSVHWLQCQDRCNDNIWPNDAEFIIDESTLFAADPLPLCPACGKICRPNVLMFDDVSWDQTRSRAQNKAFERFQYQSSGRRIVIIEMGAGKAIPTIRRTSEAKGRKRYSTIIRINPHEPQIIVPHISIASGALSALQHLDAMI